MDSGETTSIPEGALHLPGQAQAGRSRERLPGREVLAERLRVARLAAHLTQQEVAGERFSKI